MMQRRLAPPPKADSVRSAAILAFSLSPRAIALLGAGLIWVIPALVDRRALLGMLVWDVMLLALAAADLSRLPRAGNLRVTRRWAVPLFLDTVCRIDLTIDNESSTPIGLRIADYMPVALREDLAMLTGRALPGEAAEVSYDVRPRERGDHETGVVALTWFSGWGLVERWGTASLEQRVRVYPDVMEGRTESLYLIRSRQTALEKRRARFAGAGREFESLRDYRDGDERRDVCWPVSARRGKLVTKVYQPERSQAVWVLVDAGRLLRAQVGTRTMLDVTVTAALTLAQVALGSGDRVGLMAYGRRLQHRLAPAAGAAHLRSIVEALATVRADAVEADHATAAATLMTAQKRRALVVWLTEVAETAGVPEIIDQAVGVAARHLVLFAVMRQPEVQALALAVPGSVAEMYRVVAAQEALERREALLHGLRRRGTLVVEVSPADLAAGLVGRYLETKERGLL